MRRHIASSEPHEGTTNSHKRDYFPHVNNHSSDKSQRQWLGNRYFYSLIVFICALYLCIHWENTRGVAPIGKSELHRGEFVAELAREKLQALTAFGMRTVGTEANEVHAVRYLLDELNAIKRAARPVHLLDIDHQLTSGTFTLQFLGEFSSSYDNLQNIVAKFGPRTGANDSLLVNCHFDSVISSPGASDDAVSCALMLEVLRVLSKENDPLLYNIIFLFNGAEENILQASHGFITQHKWAGQVRAVVNLDSAGSGGKELVFQAGPEFPWLIKTYARVTKYPFASSVAQEIFQSGIIPSDTDYRIFRDFADIPGIDIAYVHNGYVYHTRFDTADRIDDGSIQRGGENLLALVRALANSRQLVSPEDDDRHGNMVFYDIIGQMVIIYPQRMGTVLNVLAVVLSLADVARRILGRGRHAGLTGKEYVSGLLRATGALCVSTVGVVATVAALALGMTAVGRNMTWFYRPEFLALLYALPALVAYISVHCAVKKHVFSAWTNFWQVEFIFFEANLIFCTLTLALMTAMGIRSAFMLMIWVAIPLIVRVKLPQYAKINFREHTLLFFIIHLAAIAFPLLCFLYLVYNYYVVFVPLMGRIGPTINPDVLLGCVTGFCVCITMSFSAGLIYLVRNIKRILAALSCLALLGYLAAIFTPYGFPYSDDPASPAPQRQVITAISNNHYDLAGHLTRDDSHIMFVPFDYNGLAVLEPYVPEVAKATPHVCDGPQCGVPYFYPVLHFCSKQFMFPIKKWSRSPGVEATLTKREKAPGASKELFHFAVTGPSHMSVYIELEAGTNLTRWSLGNHIPHPTKMVDGYLKDNFFVYYSYGRQPDGPWTFWIEIDAPNAVANIPAFRIAFGGHFLHGEASMTPELQSILRRLPGWVHTYAWASSYHRYEYTLDRS